MKEDRVGKTRVLVFIDWYLPGYKAGGPIRSLANLIESLKEDLKFSLVTRDTDYLETSPYPDLESNKWIEQGDESFHYLSSGDLNYSTVKNLLLRGDYEVVYLNSMFSYFFSFLPLWILNGSATDIVLAPRGMLAKGALSIKPLKKRVYLYVCKLFGLVANIRFQATSEQEVHDIKAVFGSESQIMLAPNIPAAVPETNNHLDTKAVGSVKLISVARIAPEKNLLYALNVLSKVKGKVHFDIYGVVYSEEYWNSCKEVIDTIPENITVVVHDGVPQTELFELLQESHYLLMPSRSENFGHIIWESLACGCPVIISDQTPWLNLEEKNIGFDISLKSEAKFVATIESCIDMGREEYTLKSDSAYNFAKTYAANSKSIQLSRELFTQIRGNS